MPRSRARSATVSLVFVFCGIVGAAREARAQSSALDRFLSPSGRRIFEASAGADTAGPSWTVYGGLTAALYGDINADGLRVRAGGGYGRYRYTRPLFDPATRHNVSAEFFGEHAYYDVLIGQQWTFGPTTLKAFGGVTTERHELSPGQASRLQIDDENAVQGRLSGVKIVLETWTRLSDWGFFQADASWSQPFESYGGRLRLGYFVTSNWSTGVETAAFGNMNYDGGRIGAFARYTWSRGEISVSAGIDGDRDHIGGGYASISTLARF